MNRVARRHAKSGLARVMLAVVALIVGTGAIQPPADVPAAGPEGATADDTKLPPDPEFDWVTVVNNNDLMPGVTRNFNSYNQPSVNVNGLVVIRARSRGGDGQGPATHGIYTRDMAAGSPIIRILDRTTLVPYPNNLGTTFVATPAAAHHARRHRRNGFPVSRETTPSTVSARELRSTGASWASGAPGAPIPRRCASTARRKATGTVSPTAIETWSARTRARRWETRTASAM